MMPLELLTVTDVKSIWKEWLFRAMGYSMYTSLVLFVLSLLLLLRIFALHLASIGSKSAPIMDNYAIS